MAQPPPKPNPLHGPPPAQEQPTEATKLQLNIHGIPPKPNMAEASPPLEDLGEVVNAEMEAGRKALENNKIRTNAEHEAGRRNIAPRQRSNSQSEEKKPSLP